MNQYEKPKPMKNAERYDEPGIFFFLVLSYLMIIFSQMAMTIV